MSVIVPKEIKEALAYLKSIDISLGRIAKALEDQTYEDEEEDDEFGKFLKYGEKEDLK